MQPQLPGGSNPQGPAESQQGGGGGAEPFRILSLDGGGIMGAFTASVLAVYEADCWARHRKRLVDHFDLITGTSTGGIIAIGLAMGITAEKIRDFYQSKGASIFPPGSWPGGWLRRVWGVFRPKFPADGLHGAIHGIIGGKPLKMAETRLVIPSYDINTGKVYLFKTPHHPWYTHHANLPALDAAMATSAAPTYFPAHAIGRGTFIDGGLWANCPTVVGLVEAFDFLAQPPDRVRMLSISTTSYPFRLDNPGKLRGLFGWAPKIIDTFMFGQAQAAVNTARCLLRRGLFHRIDYQTPPNAFPMDNAQAAADLIGMGQQIAELRENIGVVEKDFLNGRTVTRFTPIDPAQSGSSAET